MSTFTPEKTRTVLKSLGYFFKSFVKCKRVSVSYRYWIVSCFFAWPWVKKSDWITQNAGFWLANRCGYLSHTISKSLNQLFITYKSKYDSFFHLTKNKYIHTHLLDPPKNLTHYWRALYTSVWVRKEFRNSGKMYYY